jgi:hypothetical protein
LAIKANLYDSLHLKEKACLTILYYYSLDTCCG